MNKGTLTIHILSSFIGKALAMTAAILSARLKTQNLVWLKNQALRTHNTWMAFTSLTTQVKEDLQWWIKSLAQWKCKWPTVEEELAEEDARLEAELEA